MISLPETRYAKSGDTYIAYKTAKALGIDVPPSIFALADEVIE